MGLIRIVAPTILAGFTFACWLAAIVLAFIDSVRPGAAPDAWIVAVGVLALWRIECTDHELRRHLQQHEVDE